MSSAGSLLEIGFGNIEAAGGSINRLRFRRFYGSMKTAAVGKSIRKEIDAC
jgi:hypothetical protein